MTVYFVSRILIGVVLALASVGKWLNLGWFATVLTNYRLVPPAAARAAAVVVTGCESVLAGLLLTGRGHPWAEIAASVFLAGATAAIALNLLRGRTDLECGCSGRAGHRIEWNLVVRNLGLIGLALLSGNVMSMNLSGRDASPLVFLCCMSLVAWPAAARWLQPGQRVQPHALDPTP